MRKDKQRLDTCQRIERVFGTYLQVTIFESEYQDEPRVGVSPAESE